VETDFLPAPVTAHPWLSIFAAAIVLFVAYRRGWLTGVLALLAPPVKQAEATVLNAVAVAPLAAPPVGTSKPSALDDAHALLDVVKRNPEQVDAAMPVVTSLIQKAAKP